MPSLRGAGALLLVLGLAGCAGTTDPSRANVGDFLLYGGQMERETRAREEQAGAAEDRLGRAAQLAEARQQELAALQTRQAALRAEIGDLDRQMAASRARIAQLRETGRMERERLDQLEQQLALWQRQRGEAERNPGTSPDEVAALQRQVDELAATVEEIEELIVGGI